MSAVLTLAAVRERQQAQAHEEYLRSRIAWHRDRAKQALKLARIAARHGNAGLAAGLLDEACTYRAMALGLEQQRASQEVRS